MSRSTWRIPLLCAVLGGCAAAPDTAPDPRVEARIAAHGEPVRVAMWIGDADGRARVARRANESLPAASAIKTAFLVELFAAHAGRLDQPAFAPGTFTNEWNRHFAAQLGAERLAALGRRLAAASVRTLGVWMVRARGVDNLTYNAAANAVLERFGGPAGMTQAIHARDPGFAGIVVRRAMLAPRAEGDNVASAASLAAVLGRIARGALPGVDDDTGRALRAVLRVEDDAVRGAHFAKGGSLDSDPITRVVAGWYERDGTATVYVVMAAQPVAGSAAPGAAGRRLQELVVALREIVLSDAGVAVGR